MSELSQAQRSGHQALPQFIVGSIALIFALHYGQDFVVPVILSILLAFCLTPLVVRLERLGLPSKLAVILSFGSTLLILALAGWITFAQFGDFSKQLPLYQRNLTQRITSLENDLRKVVASTFPRLRVALARTDQELLLPDITPSIGSTPLIVRLQSGLGSVLNLMLVMAFSLSSAFFLCLSRRELPGRLLRMLGETSAQRTYAALNEVGARVGRLLFAQLIVNFAFASVMSCAFYLIELPFPILFGLLLGAARFIPYVGIIFGGTLVILVSLASFQGWFVPVLVLAAILIPEIIISNLVEPMLLGKSTGITPEAILISALFWTCMWGPIGLLLSTPIMVCLVVLGRHMPELWFIPGFFAEEHRPRSVPNRITSPAQKLADVTLADDEENRPQSVQ